MAKNRYVNTKIWRDAWFCTLDPSEAFLFIYLLTNPETTIAGVYEIPIRQISVDTGLDSRKVEIILDRFEADGKVFYEKGWVIIANFIKHQAKNPSVKKGIESTLNDCPDWIKDRLSTGCLQAATNLNLNINSNSNLNFNHQVKTDDDGVILFYESCTGNKATERDMKVFEELEHGPDICKIGIAQSILRSPTKINSLQYCVPAIKEAAGTGMQDTESYLQFLSQKVTSAIDK